MVPPQEKAPRTTRGKLLAGSKLKKKILVKKSVIIQSGRQRKHILMPDNVINY
jgi:hypothetical protein